jgi:NAD(P)-dependent dehydrogenase (short-subunit alcohol dehydrogenase family)
VNLLGTLRMTRACLPSLKERGGSVVFIGTQSAVAAPTQVKQAAYAASKGALTSAMYSLARELGPFRIRVNTVLPGWMWGPPVQAYVRFTAQTEGVPEDVVLARLTERMALPEPATDADVADAAVFLASDRARSVTGQSLLVNAGELMR